MFSKILIFLLVVISLVVIVFSFYLQIPLVLLLKYIMNSLYPREHVNGFLGHSKYVYLAVYLIVIMCSFYFILRRHCLTKVSIREAIFNIILAFFFIISAFQFVGRAVSLKKDIQKRDYLSKNSSVEKVIFGFPYSFAIEAKKHLPKTCKAAIISDSNFSDDLSMTNHRILIYFMLPVNIRSHEKNDNPDCVILFMKKNAKEHIPEGYLIKYQYDENNLVALRGDLF